MSGVENRIKRRKKSTSSQEEKKRGRIEREYANAEMRKNEALKMQVNS